MLPNVITIDLYNFELYHIKVGAFFETQCRFIIIAMVNNDKIHTAIDPS